MAPEDVRETALELWRTINLKNLERNILPTRRRAQLILQKGENHRVKAALLRKL
jgi:type I pantothenate kinase